MASLETEFTIKKFAALVVIHYSKVNYLSYWNSELENCLSELKQHKTYKAFFACIDRRLEVYYKNITDKISVDEFENKLYVTSKRDYMNQLLSRCLKLSEGNPDFFDFFLVCVFICKFSECIYVKHKCYKILEATADCLEIVYSMKYSNYFKENNYFKGFFDFCTRLYFRPSTKPVRGGGRVTCPPEDVEPGWEEKVKKLGCLNVIDGAIYLSETDKKIQVNMPFFTPTSPDIPVIFLVKNEPSGNSQDAELNNWELVPKKNEPDVICKHCLAKCSQYPEYLINELTVWRQFKWRI